MSARLSYRNLSLASFMAGAMLLWPVGALADTVSVPFEAGFIGDIGNNSQKADNIQTFSTLGIERATFSQDTDSGQFEDPPTLQGNDIPGTLTLLLASDQTLIIEGAVVWRYPNGASNKYSLGFIPAPSTNISFSYGGGNTYTVTGSDFDTNQNPSSNIGLRNINADYDDGTVDGENVQGNSAGALDALNDYLGDALQEAPDTSVSVVSQTTTDTTPVITGSLSSALAAGESLEIIVNGVVYDGGNVTVQGTTWSIQVLVAIPLGTYDVTASIIDSEGFSAEDGTNSELVIVDVVTYSIGGTIVDLSDGGTLILANSDGQQLTINGPANSFVFPTALADGSGYSVSVAQQPDGQRCVVKRKQGTISGAAVDDIEVKCLELNINSGGSSGGVNNSSCAGLKSQSSRFKVPDNPPANFDFPYGVFEFRAEECDVGATIEIVLQFPQALPSDTKHWKLINGTWEDWTNRVSIVGNKITFSITDGGEGDTDGEANGVIVDPSGPGMPSSVTVQSYSVSANAGTGGSAACTPNSVTSGGSSTCTATPDTGYEFDSWTGGCAGQGATCSLSNITSDQSSTASFTALTYTVSATAGTGGNASCSPSSVNYNGSSTCAATPDTGYEFDSWTGGCAGQGATCSLSNITSNQSSVARFKPPNLLAVYGAANPSEGGSVTCDPEFIQSGEDSVCTAAANAGYEFDSWSGDCSGQGSTCSLTNITSDQSSTASFTALTYSVSATTGTGGSASCSPSSVNYNGSSTCTATPDTGYEFDSWTGNCAGQGATCSLTGIESDVSVEASFAPEDLPYGDPSAEPIPLSPLWLHGLLSLLIILLGRRSLYSS